MILEQNEITLEEGEIGTIIDALYDAEIHARRSAQENAAYGTDTGRLRAKEWREAAQKYHTQRKALLRREAFCGR